jgi:hypothetical protein
VERLAVLVQEEISRIRFHHQGRPHFVAITLDPLTGTAADRHHAILPAFALADHQRAVPRVDVIEFQVRKLQAADAGRVQGLDDRAIADAEFTVEYGGPAWTGMVARHAPESVAGMDRAVRGAGARVAATAQGGEGR